MKRRFAAYLSTSVVRGSCPGYQTGGNWKIGSTRSARFSQHPFGGSLARPSLLPFRLQCTKRAPSPRHLLGNIRPHQAPLSFPATKGTRVQYQEKPQVPQALFIVPPQKHLTLRAHPVFQYAGDRNSCYKHMFPTTCVQLIKTSSSAWKHTGADKTAVPPTPPLLLPV